METATPVYTIEGCVPTGPGPDYSRKSPYTLTNTPLTTPLNASLPVPSREGILSKHYTFFGNNLNKFNDLNILGIRMHK